MIYWLMDKIAHAVASGIEKDMRFTHTHEWKPVCRWVYEGSRWVPLGRQIFGEVYFSSGWRQVGTVCRYCGKRA